VHSKRRLTQALFLTTGLLSATYGAMFAALAEFRDGFGVSESGIGWIVSAGFFTSFIVQLTLAPLADRGHAKKLVLIGVAITICATVGMAFGKSLVPLLSARILMGIGAGLSVPAIRRIFLLLDPTQVGANLGKLLATDVTGFVSGPILGALTIDRFGVAAPFLILAAILSLCLPIVWQIKIKEGEPGARSERFAVDLLKNPGVLSAVFIGVAFFVMIGTFDSLFVLVMTDMKASKFLAKSGIVVFALPMIVLGSVGGRLTQRVGPFRSATYGMAIAALFMASYGRLPSPWAMTVVGLIHGVSDGLTVTGTAAAVSMNVPEHRQAAAQGLLGGVETLAGGLVAFTAGSLYHHTSRAFVFTACSATMLVLVGISLTLSLRGKFFSQRSPQ
jgi:MFS family permease